MDRNAQSLVCRHPMPRHGRAIQGQPINLKFGFPDFFQLGHSFNMTKI